MVAATETAYGCASLSKKLSSENLGASQMIVLLLPLLCFSNIDLRKKLFTHRQVCPDWVQSLQPAMQRLVLWVNETKTGCPVGERNENWMACG